jgi:hypothetical protein
MDVPPESTGAPASAEVLFVLPRLFDVPVAAVAFVLDPLAELPRPPLD